MKKEDTKKPDIDLSEVSAIFSQYVEHFRQEEAEAKGAREAFMREAEARGAQKALLGVAEEINRKLGVGNVKEEEKEKGSNDSGPEGGNQQGLRAVPGSSGDPVKHSNSPKAADTSKPEGKQG